MPLPNRPLFTFDMPCDAVVASMWDDPPAGEMRPVYRVHYFPFGVGWREETWDAFSLQISQDDIRLLDLPNDGGIRTFEKPFTREDAIMNHSNDIESLSNWRCMRHNTPHKWHVAPGSITHVHTTRVAWCRLDDCPKIEELFTWTKHGVKDPPPPRWGRSTVKAWMVEMEEDMDLPTSREWVTRSTYRWPVYNTVGTYTST